MHAWSRILSSIASVAAAAGLSLPVLGPAFAASGLEDVQVGERELQTRIAIICDGACAIEKRSDELFFLPGVDAEMSLDLSDRSLNIEGFSIVKDAEGSVLRIAPTRLIEYANAKPCRIKERPAQCVDIFFADALPREARIETPSLGPEPAVAKPNLRESEPDRLSRFARLAPPERLAPPQGTNLASVQPAFDPAAQSAPSIRDTVRETAPIANVSGADGFDYAASIKSLLGKNLTPGYCASAKATLQADPWALEAMSDVGLCEAAAGNAEKGEQVLSRLLEYTPDAYEAHVGRALIAVQAGEKSIARRYFQDALNAPPPIEESNRIVAAMNRL
ncbi:hypothetical protein PUV54_10160 [Hyphococcus flavus]|uniref:Tetratricopeptide repeat protein n=1 Tax=Hyphococcus flavus TaxID=1866326 RepID=A0AAE9ZGA7_9PROT|nr:hypothetical protein [Hyphococcus flavus]WDI30321.1 hypothetical protein PUV54_10160 [Hyphococcus flavus]